jgi:hypothetical protein|tara:strand:- start:279 stop:1043 length:765 start_codon:yes stop_codon:yes gene_type:complete
MIVATEQSTHWYKPDGTAAYGSTLRDARKEKLLPSVTTVTSLLAAPGLEAWKQSQLVLAALTMPREELGDDLDKAAARIVSDARQAGKDAATRGTEIHNDCESILRNGKWEHSLINDAVHAWVLENVRSVDWCEKTLVDTITGYAGRADALIEHVEHGLVLIDWKSQKFKRQKRGFKPTFYDKWILQLAAYAECISKPVRVMSVAINTQAESDDDVIVVDKLWDQEEQDEAYKQFINLHSLWCWDRNYHPSKEM